MLAVGGASRGRFAAMQRLLGEAGWNAEVGIGNGRTRKMD
jgi:hypothetical protein